MNSLWPSDAIRWQGTESTLAQVMAWCLTTPSHYLNQCWLIISKALSHSSEGIIMRRSEDTYQSNKIEIPFKKNAYKSPRGQWVKSDWSFMTKGVPQGFCTETTSIQHFSKWYIFSLKVTMSLFAIMLTIIPAGLSHEVILVLTSNLEMSPGITLNWFDND